MTSPRDRSGMEDQPLEGRVAGADTQRVPAIDVTYQNLVHQTDLAWEAIRLETSRKPFLFGRGTIVRIEHDGKGNANSSGSYPRPDAA